jgi:hypothetical protein
LVQLPSIQCCFDYLGSQCVGQVPRLKGWLLFDFK